MVGSVNLGYFSYTAISTLGIVETSLHLCPHTEIVLVKGLT